MIGCTYTGNMKKMKVYISDDTYRKYKNMAIRYRVTMNFLINEALKSYLKDEENKCDTLNSWLPLHMGGVLFDWKDIEKSFRL